MPNIGMVSMLDAETGETVDWYQFKKVRLNYENIIGKWIILRKHSASQARGWIPELTKVM
jgi:hypothetical protein